MIKRLILALSFLLAAPAFAGPQPPDVPAYVAISPSLATGTTPNVIGDGSTTGGTPPANAYELTEVSPVADITPYTNTVNWTPLTFTGHIDGTILTVVSGSVRTGDYISGAGMNQSSNGIQINASLGGGTYSLKRVGGGTVPSQTVPTETMHSNNFNFCSENILGTGPISCTEAKFRAHIDNRLTKVLFDDPIRNYGLPGTSHCHTFFGNMSANAYSTYATLRQHAVGNPSRYAMASGGPLNSTAYWAPCVTKVVGGVTYSIKPSGLITLYYASNPLNSPQITRLILGLRYVTNYNMDDPEQTWFLKYIYDANHDAATLAAFPGGRYLPTGNGSWGSGSAKWQCQHNGVVTAIYVNYKTYLKDANGNDPWNGSCVAGDLLWMQLTATAKCWDGVNMWSTTGYRHVIPQVWDNAVAGGGDWVCPNHWFRIPGLVLQVHYDAHQGPTDYMSWRLSSDDMAQAKLDSLPLCTTGYANAPCTTTANPHVVLNGESFHTDWMNGWQKSIVAQWNQNCTGIGNESGTPHQCDFGGVSPTLALKEPTAGTVYSTASTANMVRLTTVHTGPKTMQMNGH